MNDRRRDLGSVLRSVGDAYVGERPADLAEVRAGVERYRRRRLRLVTGATVLATGAAALIVYFAVGSDAPESLPPAGEPELSIVHRVRLDGSPLQVAAKEDVAWVARSGDGVVSSVEVGSTDPVWEKDIGTVPTDIVATADGLWVADRENNRIVQLDPASGDEIESWQLEGPPGRIAVGTSAVRATVDRIGVVRIDRATGQTKVIYDGSVIDIAMGESAFWVMNVGGGIVPIDPDSGNQVFTLPTPSVVGEGEITYLREAIYYGQEGHRTLIRIDEKTGVITDRILLPAPYQDIDADRRGLWVLVRDGRLGRLFELDPRSGEILGEGLHLDDDPVDIVTGDDGVWVALASGGRVILVR
jgi:hypothetical protein